MQYTSESDVSFAAVANSAAAKSCSSLAAKWFAFLVSRDALRAWIWAYHYVSGVACGRNDALVHVLKTKPPWLLEEDSLRDNGSFTSHSTIISYHNFQKAKRAQTIKLLRLDESEKHRLLGGHRMTWGKRDRKLRAKEGHVGVVARVGSRMKGQDSWYPTITLIVL